MNPPKIQAKALHGSSHHESFEASVPVKTSSDRSFGYVFAVAFAALGTWWIATGRPAGVWALIAAAVFALLAVFWPRSLAPLNRAWTRFGLLLHKITNPIIMGLVFYVAVVPTGLVFRMLGKDPLRRRFDSQAKTYWIEREPPGPAPDTMTHQF